MKHYAEIEFKVTGGLDKYELLKEYAARLSKLSKLGEGVEHDSVHYVEDTYFRWDIGALKVKLFWCDEEGKEDLMCLSLSSYEEDISLDSEALHKALIAEGLNVLSFDQYEK